MPLEFADEEAGRKKTCPVCGTRMCLPSAEDLRKQKAVAAGSSPKTSAPQAQAVPSGLSAEEKAAMLQTAGKAAVSQKITRLLLMGFVCLLVGPAMVALPHIADMEVVGWQFLAPLCTLAGIAMIVAAVRMRLAAGRR
jgi:hypothetical protein